MPLFRIMRSAIKVEAFRKLQTFQHAVSASVMVHSKRSILPSEQTSFHQLNCFRRVSSSQKKTGQKGKGNERVRVEYPEDGIAHVILARSNKLNALDMEMFESIAQTAADLRNDTTIRAVVFSGEGRAFCTGLDTKSLVSSGNPFRAVARLLERPSGYGRNETRGSNDGEYGPSPGNLAQDVAYLWRDLPVPVIAVLHGMCYGGGMQIALGADFRFATPDCRLSIMEAKWGLIPDMSGSITIRELMRIDVAKELTMTGRILSGTEAAEVGLVTRCVDDPLVEAFNVARQIKLRSPDSIAATKLLFQETWCANEEDCLKVESWLQRKLIASWNQVAASGRNFGVKIPYIRRKNMTLPDCDSMP